MDPQAALQSIHLVFTRTIVQDRTRASGRATGQRPHGECTLNLWGKAILRS